MNVFTGQYRFYNKLEQQIKGGVNDKIIIAGITRRKSATINTPMCEICVELRKMMHAKEYDKCLTFIKKTREKLLNQIIKEDKDKEN